MKTWSIPAGRIFGVNLRLHISFVFLLLYVLITQVNRAGTGASRGAVAIVFIAFGAVLLHEMAHLVAGIRLGVRPRALILLPLGGLSIYDNRAPLMNAWQTELRIALAGPAVNFVIAGLAALMMFALGMGAAVTQMPLIDATDVLRSMVWVNVLLGAVNLLPAYPLDGGRILRAVLADGSDPVTATRRAISISHVFATFFMLAGIWLHWPMLIGFFLFVAAQIEERMAVFHSVLENVRMEDVMLTDFSTLSPADTLEDALQKAVHSLQDDFPVVRGGDMVGVISRQKIVDALRAEGNGYVQSVMNPTYEIAQRQESLGSVFQKLVNKGMTIVPVVDQDRLVGIVTLQNLMHSISLLAESRHLRGR